MPSSSDLCSPASLRDPAPQCGTVAIAMGIDAFVALLARSLTRAPMTLDAQLQRRKCEPYRAAAYDRCVLLSPIGAFQPAVRCFPTSWFPVFIILVCSFFSYSPSLVCLIHRPCRRSSLTAGTENCWHRKRGVRRCFGRNLGHCACRSRSGEIMQGLLSNWEKLVGGRVAANRCIEGDRCNRLDSHKAHDRYASIGTNCATYSGGIVVCRLQTRRAPSDRRVLSGELQ